METRINGLRYNTETAKELARWSSDCPVNDFNYYEEWLFKKRTGEYFLYGEGGPASPYAEYVEHSGSVAGYGIKPLTRKQAKNWLERAANEFAPYGQTYEQEFGLKKTGKNVAVIVKLDKALKDKLDKLAAHNHMTIDQVTANLIENAD